MDTRLEAFLDELLAALPPADVAAGEQAARRELRALPTPICGDDPLVARRAELARVVAIAAARAGRSDGLHRLLLQAAQKGGSWVPVVQLELALGEPRHAAILARLALAKPNVLERERIEALLESCASPPDQWHDALVALARAPSVEAWDELFRFVPANVFYTRVRNAIRTLDTLGVETSMLFRFACHFEVMPEAVALVESGRLPEAVVVERAKRFPDAAGQWYASAAQGALARGELAAAARLAGSAVRAPGQVGHEARAYALEELRRHPDEAFQRMLDREGVPQEV